MSEMVERVIDALNAAPRLCLHQNESRPDGKVYEIWKPPLDQPVVIAAFRNLEVAAEHCDQLQVRVFARAAIAAMREPAEAMLWAANDMFPEPTTPPTEITCQEVGDRFWRAMIDAALRDEVSAEGPENGCQTGENTGNRGQQK